MSDHNVPTELQEEAIEVMSVIEDSVEYICNEYQLSGEKVWVMINALSEAKIKQFPEPDDD